MDGLSVIGEFWDDMLPIQPFKPVIDAPFYGNTSLGFVPGEPLRLFDQGDFADLPLMIGSNANEGLLFLFPFVNQALGFANLEGNWTEVMAGILFNRQDGNFAFKKSNANFSKQN